MLYPPHPNEQTWQAVARRVAQGIRRRALELTIQQNGCYLSQACSAAEILATMYTRVLNLGPSEAPPVPPPFPGVPGEPGVETFTGAAYHGPRGPEYDRFIVSPAHYAVAIYAALIEVGRMSPEVLADFNTDGSTVEMIGAEHSPGMELTTGSFGQALSQAAGIAAARRLKGETGRTWVFMSDGEFQEGQTWEALQAIAFHRLDGVGVIVDVNGQQVDGRMEDVMAIEPLADRVTAFGARAIPVDGHDVEAIARAAETPPEGKAVVVLAYTNPAQGIDLLEARKPDLHYVRFKSDEERQQYRDFLARMTAAAERVG